MMNRKVLVLVLAVVLLLAAAGVVSARPAPAPSVEIQPDTSLDVVCSGGYMVAIVDNNIDQSVVHVTCYSFQPPAQDG
jgi:hypothetical protein